MLTGDFNIQRMFLGNYRELLNHTFAKLFGFKWNRILADLLCFPNVLPKLLHVL